MRILGIDPGTQAMGYGLIDEDGDNLVMIDCGALTPPKRSPIGERLHHLYRGLGELMARYQPDEVAIEEPFVARNVRSALAVGRAQAVAILAAASRGIPAYRYSPTQVKQRVADYGASSKEQVQEMVKIHLGLPQIPQPRDAADALAVAICHLGETHMSRRLTSDDEVVEG